MSSSGSQAVSNSPGTPPANRSIMSSPFSVLQRPEHGFAHIHPQGHQVNIGVRSFVLELSREKRGVTWPALENLVSGFSDIGCNYVSLFRMLILVKPAEF